MRSLRIRVAAEADIATVVNMNVVAKVKIIANAANIITNIIMNMVKANAIAMNTNMANIIMRNLWSKPIACTA